MLSTICMLFDLSKEKSLFYTLLIGYLIGTVIAAPRWGKGVLWISSDRDDWRIFRGFEIFDFGIFLGRKILASIFFGQLDLP